jgi:hypothetical protein
MLDISQSIRFDDDVEDGKSHELKVYSLDRIKAATCNFSDSNKLGEGGFGPVYMVCSLPHITVTFVLVLGVIIKNIMNHCREHYLGEKK